jgi:hypothetical protein
LDIYKAYSRKSFWVLALLMVVVAAMMNIGLYKGIQWVILNSVNTENNQLLIENISRGVLFLNTTMQNYYTWVLPVTLGSFILFGSIIWLALKLSILSLLKLSIPNDDSGLSKKQKKDFVDQRIEQDRKRRLFLHSLSVLQRDGRLLDFFNEDLSLYEDDQIGAAVRSIQEDCKKAVKKYINPKPVIDKEEGKKVSVEPGFDLDSIKLVGNVTGDPPFEGILKHSGWKAAKKEIPKLSDIRDSSVIMPAEVQIN